MNKVRARCCMTSGCFDCNKDSEFIQTTPVLTPFYRPVLKREDIRDGIPAPESNYLPYELFAFRTKFERKLYHVNPTYHFSFVSKQINNMMVITIDLFKGDTFVPLDTALARRIQKLVGESVATYPKHSLLLDSKTPIVRGTKTFTKAWVNSLFPFLSFEDRFEVIVENNHIYINLSEDLEYQDRYTKLYLKMIDTLFSYYERGIVPLSPRFHSHIISDWELEKVYDQYIAPGQVDYPGEIALYEATWKNYYFAPDMVSFVYDRIQNNTEIKILVGDNFVRRHFVAVELTKLSQRRTDAIEVLEDYIPTFSDKYVYVPAENVLQAFEIANAVVESKSQSSGKVEIVPLEKEEDYDGMTEAILQKYEGLNELEDIILYRTIDVPSYVLSFLLPYPETVDSLKILKT